MNYRISLFSGWILFSLFLTTAFSQSKMTPNASFLGTHTYERVGYHVHTAGDVNGDGYDDFLIGTFHHKDIYYMENVGVAYLILGKKEADWGFSKSLAQSDARFLGKESYDAVGYFLGGGGDINGDG